MVWKPSTRPGEGERECFVELTPILTSLQMYFHDPCSIYWEFLWTLMVKLEESKVLRISRTLPDQAALYRLTGRCIIYYLFIYLLPIYLSSGGGKVWIFDGDNGTDEIIFQTFTLDKLGQVLTSGCRTQTCHRCLTMFSMKSTILPPSPFCHTYRKWVLLEVFLHNVWMWTWAWTWI